MISEFTYLVLEVIAITALVLYATNLVISCPKNRSAWLFALICLSNACYLLTRMSYKMDETFRLDLGFFTLPVQIIMNLGSGFWMFFCYSLFQDRSRIPRWLLALFGVQIVLSLGRLNFLPMSMNELDRTQPDSFTWILFLVMPLLLQACIGLFAVFFTVKGWSCDLVNSRRLFRWGCMAYFSLLFIGVAVPEMALPIAEPSQRILLNNWITVLAAVSACALVIFAPRITTNFQYSSVTKTDTVAPGRTREKNQISNEVDYQKFREVFEGQKAYLQHGLSIAALAEKMTIPQYRLRQLIHSRLGYRNFNALLHDYRIKDACEQLSDPHKQDVPVLTIALSLGYQSIAPFNQAFRDIVGQTPTGFRNSRLSNAKEATVAAS